MGQEITFGEMQPARLPKARTRRSAHVLDLRSPARSVSPGSTEASPLQQELPPDQQQRRLPILSKLKLRLPPRRQLLGQVLRAGVVLAAAIGFLSLNVSLAERFIGIYLVVALIYAVDSQRTFLVALIFLIMVAVWSALGNSVSAEDYATYAFYFLAIGLLTAIREMLTGKNQPVTEH